MEAERRRWAKARGGGQAQRVRPGEEGGGTWGRPEEEELAQRREEAHGADWRRRWVEAR